MYELAEATREQEFGEKNVRRRREFFSVNIPNCDKILYFQIFTNHQKRENSSF